MHICHVGFFLAQILPTETRCNSGRHQRPSVEHLWQDMVGLSCCQHNWKQRHALKTSINAKPMRSFNHVAVQLKNDHLFLLSKVCSVKKLGHAPLVHSGKPTEEKKTGSHTGSQSSGLRWHRRLNVVKCCETQSFYVPLSVEDLEMVGGLGDCPLKGAHCRLMGHLALVGWLAWTHQLHGPSCDENRG